MRLALIAGFGLRIADLRGIRSLQSAIRNAAVAALRSKAGLEEVLDGVAAAERRRNADEPRNDRPHGERHQRIRHRRRRLVRPVPFTVAMTAAVIVRGGVMADG